MHERVNSNGATPGFDPMAAPVIETTGLTRRYGNTVALENLDLRLPKAAIGLLGANGAGKTTLIRLLLGLSKPTSGSATVLGYDAFSQGPEMRARIGYMPESDVLPMGATAADFVAHMGEMSGLPARAARQRAADVLYQVGLDEERYRLIKGFSTGMKQRVKLAQAIVHDPDLVFLDEPTNGMDPQGRDEMLDLINRIHRSLGIAVVISSHILEDIERVCDYVTILNAGRLVLSEPMASIGKGATELIVRVEGDPASFRSALEAAGVATRTVEDALVPGEFLAPLADDSVFDLIRDVAAERGEALRTLRPRARTLEDVYLGNVEADDARREAANAAR